MVAGVAAALQADPQLLAQLDRLVWAYWFMAAATLVIALIAIGGGVLGFAMLRRLLRLLDAAEDTMKDVAPRARPLIQRAERAAEEVGRMAEAARVEYIRLESTIQRANEGLRAMVDEAEARARRFNAIVELVQTEAEDALVDAASAARGVQATAQVLRGETGVRAAKRRARIAGDSGGKDG